MNDVRELSGDVCGSDCERMGMNLAASDANTAAHAEVCGKESDARCDLNACGGYDSGTCDGGSSTTASEVSEREALRNGGRRRGKRGLTTPSVRRARAAETRVGKGVVASDGDE